MKRMQGDDGGTKLYVAAVAGALVLTLAVVLAIVGIDWWYQDAPLNTFAPEGENAQTIQNLVTPVFIAGTLIFIAVEIVIITLAVRNRRKEDDDELPTQTHGNVKLELGWTILPAVIMVFVAVGTAVTLFELNDFSDTEMTVKVEGQQWWWQYQYDLDGDDEYETITANELVIPADTNVEMEITSNDVIHSFWIPNLNGKRDAVPGFSTSWKMQADDPGRYRGQCTEFCGLSHARMQMYVIALDEDDFAAWAENQLQEAGTTAAEAVSAGTLDSSDADEWESGKAIFESQCTGCHTVDGVGGPEGGNAGQVSQTAPNLTHLMTRDTFAGSLLTLYLGVEDTLDGDTPIDDYVTKDGHEVNVNHLEQWLRDPESVKPMAPDQSRGMPDLGLSEDQIDDLVAYLTTLK